MKTRILSFLLVLALAITFIGCGSIIETPKAIQDTEKTIDIANKLQSN